MLLNPMRRRTPVSLKKALLLFLVLTPLLFISCGEEGDEINESETDSETTNETEEIVEESAVDEGDVLPDIEMPEGYEVLSDVLGDLDGDGISERVIVFNTDREGDFGMEREMQIYAEHEGLWSLWHTSVGAILSSDRGGMMGDPFEEIEIVNGNIVIHHFGGSSEKWRYTHEYHYSDDHEWRLSAATMIYFRNCDYSETYTYDLEKSTGFHSRKKEACNENGEITESNMEIEEPLNIDSGQEAPLMDGFEPGDGKISVNGEEDTYYI